MPILTSHSVKMFTVTLKVVPTRSWSPEILNKINLPFLVSVSGHLDVNLEIHPDLKGAFKTAHSGSISLTSSTGVLPSSLSGKVCVK